jgi:hypothetical protein
MSLNAVMASDNGILCAMCNHHIGLAFPIERHSHLHALYITPIDKRSLLLHDLFYSKEKGIGSRHDRFQLAK